MNGLTELEMRADAEARHAHRELVEQLEAKLKTAVMALYEAESAPAPDHHVPQFQHVMDIIGAALAELKGETND